MTITHHILINEFPELKDRIVQLAAENPDFAQMQAEYDALTTQIEALEDDGSPISDEALEKLKYERLTLKDKLYLILHG